MSKVGYSTKADIQGLEAILDEMKNDNLEMKLEILTEIKNMREEFDAHQSSHVRINEELEDHSDRLKVLESPRN